MMVRVLGPTIVRPSASGSVPETLDRVVLRSTEAMERDLGSELAEKARKSWTKSAESGSEMAPAWMTSGWMYDLKTEQVLGQDHTPYVLPILRQSQHEAAPEVLETIDRFLPTLDNPRDRNNLVESAARALRKSSVGEVRIFFGMFCAGMTDGGLAVRRHLAEQMAERDPERAEVMRFGLAVAGRLDDGTPLGQHQASRALYASFFACRMSIAAGEHKVWAAALQSHPGNTLWSEEKFTQRYQDTAALLTDPSRIEEVSQACLDALGDPLFSQTSDPVGTLQQIGQLWPTRQQMKVGPSAGIRLEGDRLRVGGVALRTKA